MGIAVSGGMGDEYDTLESVEVFDPHTGLSCSLSTLPERRYRHTMDTSYICGGESRGDTNCLHLVNGQWTEGNTLVEKRREHCSWETEDGILLMGGFDSPTTSEIVNIDGGQGGPAFDLKYRTAKACAISDLITDSVIITGGYFTEQGVERYNMMGWVEDLPQLIEGRYDHGCGSYLRVDGTQVLLVAGGWENGPGPHSSTEVLIGDSPAWTSTTPLPMIVFGVASVSLYNTVFISGGEDGAYHSNRAEVLAWSDEEQDWVEKGKLQMTRKFHAMTTIRMDPELMELCG